MNKVFKIYLMILGGVILLLSLIEMSKTEVIDWRITFDINSTSPFGLLIFNEQADDLFHHKIERVKLMPYEYFSENTIDEKLNILLINPIITDEGWDKVLERASQGDHVFFMGDYLPQAVQESLEIKLRRNYDNPEYFVFTELQFEYDTLHIHSLTRNRTISEINPETTRILGFEENNYNNRNTNFVEVSRGQGKVFVHTEPMSITNYHLLEKADFKYVENIFSYLPDQKTIWFQNNVAEEISTTPLRFILKEKPLRYAWYLALFSMVLFIIFHAKRQQRIIPIVEPLTNTSAEFVRTIGNLYLQEGNYKDMAQKKATYFLARLRNELLIDTSNLDETFQHRLEQKTTANPEIIKRLMPLLKKAIHKQAPVQKEELIELNDLIDKILYRNNEGQEKQF